MLGARSVTLAPDGPVVDDGTISRWLPGARAVLLRPDRVGSASC